MRATTTSAWCTRFVIGLCLIVFAGWQLDWVALRRVLPNAPQTTPLTAALLLVLAVALLVSRIVIAGPVMPLKIWICRGLAGAAVLAAFFTLAQYVLQLGPSIEVVLYPRLVALNGGIYPGRPSPQTAISVVLMGLSVGLLAEPGRRLRRRALVLGLAGMVLPWLGLFGYASATLSLYALPGNPQTGISPITAIGLLALGMGVMYLRPGEGLVGLLNAHSSGGRVVRRLLPIALLLPLAMAWTVTHLRDPGDMNAAAVVTLSWGITSLLFAALVIWQGATLDRYDQRLKRQSEALVRSNQDLQRFAYVASHDLQAPLRRIGSFAQLLHDDYAERLQDDAKDWIDRIVKGVDRMRTMIQDILKYSRVESGEREQVEVPLSEVFQDVVGTFNGTMEADARMTCDPLPVVVGDRSQLSQLLQNLIGNALRYRGEQSPRVHVSAKREDNRWVVSVQDNGIGIRPEHHKRIFEIFSRLQSDGDSGSGIGLAICRRVVERHGGNIWVSSDFGKGSTFHFTLPDRFRSIPHRS